MKDYDIKDDCVLIRSILKLSQQEFAYLLEVSFSTINRIENGKNKPSSVLMEKIYNLAFTRHIKINLSKAELFQESSKNIYFHGCIGEIVGEVDLSHSREKIDFGKGFYLGETYKQAASFVASESFGTVYMFSLNESDLSILEFDVGLEWMLAVSYYRETISDEYRNSKLVKSIIDKINKADVIIAPIADNSVYAIMNQFAKGDITDLQACHSLSASYLGKQHVIKSNKALSQLKVLHRFYLCKREKEYYLNIKEEENDLAKSKVETSKIKYRRKGRYIEELLNEVK